MPTKSTFIGEVIASGKSLIENDLAGRPGGHVEMDRMAGVVSRNAAYAPVRSRYHDEIIGVVEILNKKEDKGFSSADLLLLEEAENIQDLRRSSPGASDEGFRDNSWASSVSAREPGRR